MTNTASAAKSQELRFIAKYVLTQGCAIWCEVCGVGRVMGPKEKSFAIVSLDKNVAFGDVIVIGGVAFGN